MNELDYVLIFVIGLCTIIGLRRGLVRVLISIVGIYFTVLFSGYVYKPIGDILAGGIGFGETMMHNFVYLVMLIAMTIVVELVSRAAFEQTQILALRKLDNLLGGIAGILYGVLWACLLLAPVQYGIATTGGTWTRSVAQSELVPKLNKFFINGVLDILSVFFVNGVPRLFRNQVSARVSQLWLEWVRLNPLFFL